MTVTILRVSGASEVLDVPQDDVFTTVAREIGARTLEIVNLRDGRVMMVDEDGYDIEIVEHPPRDGYAFVLERKCVRPRKPANPAATALYHAICVPGTTHQIVGDVALILDADMADDEDETEAAHG